MNTADRVYWMITEMKGIVEEMQAGECMCLDKVRRLETLSHQVGEIVSINPTVTLGRPSKQSREKLGEA